MNVKPCQTYLIKPIRFTQDMLVSTTAVNTHPAWVGGTYALGARVTAERTPTIGYNAGVPMLRVFESLAASNTAPVTDATKWLDVGPANTVAMFASRIADRTTTPGDLDVVLNVNQLVTAIAFFGLSGTEMTVIVRRSDLEVRSTHTIDLIDRTEVVDWLSFFFGNRQYKTQMVLLDIVAIPTDTIEMSITGPSAGCSRMLFGTSVELGEAQFGATWEMDNYSATDPDEFGFVDPVVRDYAPRNVLMLRAKKTATNQLVKTLIDVRGTPTVIVASQDPAYSEALINYGLVLDPTVAISFPTENILTFEFKGFV